MVLKKKPFTLLELSCAMGVLMVFMLFLMQFYTSSQDVMNRSSSKTDQFERARIIMDLLANDLQNIYYTDGDSAPCYFQKNNKTGKDFDYTEKLSFGVLRPQTFDSVSTDLAFVTYSFDHDNYTLKMGVAGDSKIDTWAPAGLTESELGILAEGVYSFRVVTEDKNQSFLAPADTGGVSEKTIPDTVKIELVLLDSGSVDALKNAPSEMKGSDSPLNPASDNFQGKDKMRHFSRVVELDRGQY